MAGEGRKKEERREQADRQAGRQGFAGSGGKKRSKEAVAGGKGGLLSDPVHLAGHHLGQVAGEPSPVRSLVVERAAVVLGAVRGDEGKEDRSRGRGVPRCPASRKGTG